jgi:hypothetical protein
MAWSIDACVTWVMPLNGDDEPELELLIGGEVGWRIGEAVWRAGDGVSREGVVV